MTDSHQGLLITFEGGEGGGKSTQVQKLTEYLQNQGREVVSVREPGGTDVSEQIREVVLATKNMGISFETEVLLFQAARAQVYQELVLPALAAGKVVLMDRSRDSSVVYQGMVRGFGKDLIEELNNISTKETYPDMTFLLEIDVETGLQRRAETGEVNRLDKESQDFHQKVRDAYCELAEANDRGRWVVIDASREVDVVFQEILGTVEAKLKGQN